MKALTKHKIALMVQDGMEHGDSAFVLAGAIHAALPDVPEPPTSHDAHWAGAWEDLFA